MEDNAVYLCNVSNLQSIFIFMRLCACIEMHACSPLVIQCVRLSVTPRAVARQAPLSMNFLRQEYWSGLPCPPAGNLPNPGIEPVSPASPALAGRFFTMCLLGNPIHEVTSSKQLFHALGRYLNSLFREKKLRCTAKCLGINLRGNFPLVLKEKIQRCKYKNFNSEKLK